MNGMLLEKSIWLFLRLLLPPPMDTWIRPGSGELTSEEMLHFYPLPRPPRPWQWRPSWKTRHSRFAADSVRKEMIYCKLYRLRNSTIQFEFFWESTEYIPNSWPDRQSWLEPGAKIDLTFGHLNDMLRAHMGTLFAVCKLLAITNYPIILSYIRNHPKLL